MNNIIALASLELLSLNHSVLLVVDRDNIELLTTLKATRHPDELNHSVKKPKGQISTSVGSGPWH